MTRVPATKWSPTPRAWHGTRGRPTRVIIHTIEGSAEGALSWFNSPANPAGTGAHLVIGKTRSYQTAELETMLWHCRNANTNGVGIEHDGKAATSKAAWLKKDNRTLLKMSANRTAWICHRYGLGIPKRGRNVFGHVDVPGNDHTDPGKGWPWLFYMALCRRAYRNLAASDGKRWTGNAKLDI